MGLRAPAAGTACSGASDCAGQLEWEEDGAAFADEPYMVGGVAVDNPVDNHTECLAMGVSPSC